MFLVILVIQSVEQVPDIVISLEQGMEVANSLPLPELRPYSVKFVAALSEV